MSEHKYTFKFHELLRTFQRKIGKILDDPSIEWTAFTLSHVTLILERINNTFSEVNKTYDTIACQEEICVVLRKMTMGISFQSYASDYAVEWMKENIISTTYEILSDYYFIHEFELK